MSQRLEQLRKDFWSIRLIFGPAIAFIAARGGDEVVILLGGAKKTQSADINIVQMLWAEYKKDITKKKYGDTLAITHKFRATIPAFRRQMLTEAVHELQAGDHGAGKAILRDY